MSRVLVTGATGLIGYRAVEQLLEQGHDVIAFELNPNAENLAMIGRDVEVVQGSVADFHHLLVTMKRAKVERVLHLAAFIMHESQTNPIRAIEVNAIGTTNVFDAARVLDVERVCSASTVSVLGPRSIYGDKPVTEDDPPSPRTPYGVTKLTTEILGRVYREQFDLDVVLIRPCLAYGVGRLTGGTGSFNSIVRAVALGQRASFDASFGGPDAMVQPIYNKDMAACFVAGTVGAAPAHTVFNAPADRGYSIRETVEILKSIAPSAAVDIEPGAANSDWMAPMIDGSLARKELGVVPKYSYRDGLAEMVDIYRSQQVATAA